MRFQVEALVRMVERTTGGDGDFSDFRHDVSLLRFRLSPSSIPLIPVPYPLRAAIRPLAGSSQHGDGVADRRSAEPDRLAERRRGNHVTGLIESLGAYWAG